MQREEFIKLLETSKDKVEVYKGVKLLEIYDYDTSLMLQDIREYLNDEEKYKLLCVSKFDKFDKARIINSISNSDFKFKILTDEVATKDFTEQEYIIILKKLGKEQLSEFFENSNLLIKLRLPPSELSVFITKFATEDEKKELLKNPTAINQLGITPNHFFDILKKINDGRFKIDMIKLYDIRSRLARILMQSESADLKKQFLDEYIEKMDDEDVIDLLCTMPYESINEYLMQNLELLRVRDFRIYDLAKMLNVETRTQFLNNLDNIGLSLNEKKEIVAVLANNDTNSIDFGMLPDELKKISDLKLKKVKGRRFDGEKTAFTFDIEEVDDFRKYRGLDRIIMLNPVNYDKSQKEKLNEFLKVCPSIGIYNEINYMDGSGSIAESTPKEYFEAEKWIEEVLGSIKEEYSKVEKLGLIDNLIGKRISYSPDFETEIFNENDARAFYKIISSGYGVCNGIANIEQYLLSKCGIKSKIAKSEEHAFLLVEDLEIGEGKYNTIVDPTWNLSSQRYGCFPETFFMSYREIRARDFDRNGVDTMSHKDDEIMKIETAGLDHMDVRRVYNSLGIVDEELDFPIKKLYRKSKLINDMYPNDIAENIKHQLSMFSEEYPDFTTCQNSSMSVISNVLFDHYDMDFNRLKVNRVFKKNDEQKTPLIYVYLETKKNEELFYVAEKGSEHFKCMSKEEFIKEFECYSEDLKRLGRY